MDAIKNSFCFLPKTSLKLPSLQKGAFWRRKGCSDEARTHLMTRGALGLGVDVLGWVLVLVLGAGWGVRGCLAVEGRLLDLGRIFTTGNERKASKMRGNGSESGGA